jgi:predicted DNA-binding transcriptional regulator
VCTASATQDSSPSTSPLPKEKGEPSDTHLTGTTYKVYHYMLKQRTPAGISEIQKGLDLSSPSVAQYHIRKLMKLGLVKEESEGYVVDRVVTENIIRIRRTSIPIQTAYIAFFCVTLFILLVFIRPATITSVYFFALMINVAALIVFIHQATGTLRRM